MRIAIASGKGGTGKTTVAVNLALVAEGGATLLDCDVEAPNAHLFLRPEIESTAPVEIQVPEVDESACTLCGACGTFCEFNALAVLKDKVIVFPELCHGCGGCAKVCPAGAIREVGRAIGIVERGCAGDTAFVHGKLNVGEPMAPPVIRAVREKAAHTGLTIIDAPPGAACPAVAAVRGCDFVVMVTEPTPFGLHDLTMAVAVIREIGLPFGVVINRADTGDGRVRAYCADENIPILAEIPDDIRVARAYSEGRTILDAVPSLRPLFKFLLAAVTRQAAASVLARDERSGHAGP